MAAFIKRFSLVALNMPHKTVITCLELMKRLINVGNNDKCNVKQKLWGLTRFKKII